MWAARLAGLVLALAAAAAAAEPDPAFVASFLSPAGRNDSSMTVGWVTDAQFRRPEAVVDFGDAPGRLAGRAEGFSRAYFNSSLVAHFAVLEGLTPGATVFYSAGGGPVRNFTAPSADDEPWAFYFYGDQGNPTNDGNDPGNTVRRLLDTLDPAAELVWLAGDTSYAQGKEFIWPEFFRVVDPLASRLPVAVVPGNHDVGSDLSGGSAGLAFATLFTHPGQCDRQDPTPFWYAFTHRGVRFVALSSEHSFWPGSPQHAWLTQELERSRGQHDWLGVVLHRPLLCSHEQLCNGTANNYELDVLEPLFLEAGVDFVSAGHVHAVEVGLPMIRGRPSPRGFAHLLTGTGGRSYCCGTWSYEQPEWSAFRADSKGFAKFTVESASRLRWEYVQGAGGDVLFSFALTKTPDGLRYLEPEAPFARDQLQRRQGPACEEETEYANDFSPVVEVSCGWVGSVGRSHGRSP